MKLKRNVLFILIYFLLVFDFIFAVQAQDTTRRFGIFIGSNNGGKDRVTLRYAVTDASSVSNVFIEMGGIARDDSVLLVEPSVREVNRRIDALHEQVARSREIYKRTEIIFYYSGHSDEEGLLLNREKYTYRVLRDRINSIPSDMRIVILDSCASGAFTRLKGGEKTQPFLADASLTAEGYAFLTSSSANEASQESDKIAASYFTHSLVAGLRGAADSVGDGRVTLNELYRFAYTETLARTETSLYGSQHPSYDIQISGTGDLVLTDVKQTSAGIIFDEKVTGRLSIRSSSEHLIAEITKTARLLELGLEPGEYRVTLQQGRDLLRADVTLYDGRRVLVTMDDFKKIGAESSRRRGDDGEVSAPETTIYTFFFNMAYAPFDFPLIGFINTTIGNHKWAQIGFVNWNRGDFSGFQTSFINTVYGNFNGFQFSFINTNNGDTNGAQVSFISTNIGETSGIQFSFVNTAVKPITGVQFGFVNVAAQGIKGTQFGFFNYADSIEKGIPFGFISIVRNGGYKAVEIGFSEYFTYNAGIKLGVEKFYTAISVSYNKNDEFTWDNLAIGYGFGSLLSIGKYFCINPEISALSSLSTPEENDSLNYLSFVPYFGVNIGKFSFLAGPSLTWLNSNKWYDKEEALLPAPLYSLFKKDIDDYNQLVVGARVAARVRF